MTSPVAGSGDPYREWDGAYILGALNPHERREFEQHLTVCVHCRRAVTELAGMPGLLGMVHAEHAVAAVENTDQVDSAVADIVPLTDLAAAARNRRSRGRALMAIAAACAVLVVGTGGWAIGRVSAAAPGAEQPAEASRTLELRPAGDVDLWASLTITPTSWGTRFDWTCDYPATGGDEEIVYTLVLVDDEGDRSTAATWSWSEVGSPSGLGASSALPLERIDSVEIGLVDAENALAVGDL